MREDIIQRIKKIKGKNNIKNWKSYFSNDELLNIQNTVKHLDIFKYENFSEIRACYIYNISVQPYCPVCNKKSKYNRHRKEHVYELFCSHKCKQSKKGQQIEIEKRTKTLSERYGVDNAFQLDETKEKAKQTCLKNFGVEYPSQSKEIQEKIKTTNLEKYGVEYVSQLKENREKAKVTTLERYGVEHATQSDEIKEKIKATNLERYGVEHATQSDEIKEKIKATNLERYGVEYTTVLTETKEKAKQTSLKNFGVENPSQSEEVQEKKKQTCLEKYGVENPSQLKIVRDKAKATNLERYGNESASNNEQISNKMKNTRRINRWDIFLIKLRNKGLEPLFTKDEYMNYSNGTKIYFKCLRCDKIVDFNVKKENGIEIKKIHCPRHTYNSLAELEIKDWIVSIKKDVEFELNKRYYYNGKKFQEIDIFLPEYNLGIEYHGIYWHCDLNKDEDYHKRKYLFFKERGIELIQIFENEWINNPEIVKSIIKTKLGLVENKIYARKCIIKELDNTTYKIFCELNHIQGYGIAKIRLGLYHNDELVQIMSFSKSRFNKKYDWENIRTCTKLNTVVVGGFSRLLKHFKEKYKGSIISYVDCRYFNGGGYLNNGFVLLNHTDPNYFYFKRGTYFLESRNKYQKHKLKSILKYFDDDLTEYDNMLVNGYLRIFDAGNIVLISPQII